LLDEAKLNEAIKGPRLRPSISRPTPTCASAPIIPAAILEQNTIVTYKRPWKQCAGAGISRIAFSSTGSIYGEATVFPNAGRCALFPVQTSLYGASKLARARD